MPGGTFTAMNKVRPGAYINFKSIPRPRRAIGGGIVSFPMPLSWGAQDRLIDIYSEDLTNDAAILAAVGMTSFSEEAKLLNAALSYSYLARIFRMDEGGTKATATIGDLAAEALYPGKFGNEITVAVSKETWDTLFTVVTYVKGSVRDSQRVSAIIELDDNQFVKFSGSGDLTVNAGTPLTGGTDGTVTEATAYEKYSTLLKTAKVQTIAVPTSDSTIKTVMAKLAESQRNDEGRKIQVVVADYAAADHESVINVMDGLSIEQIPFTTEETTIIAAAMTAGAAPGQSNTARVVTGATGIAKEKTHSEYVEGLKRGWFMFSYNSFGEVKVEKDINSLHTFTPEKDESFQLNEVIRTLDSLHDAVKSRWENSYTGKVGNTEDGRSVFRGDVAGIGNEFQRIGAIENFAGISDIDVRKGENLGDVVCGMTIRPVGAMTNLYMTVSLSV